MDLGKLTASIKAVCPIDGVSARGATKQGIEIHFTAEATEQERAAALAIVDAFDVAASPPPSIITDRQFAHALKGAGVITHADAMAFVQTGTIPPALQVVIDAIPNQQAREDAELLVAGATTFDRNHAMTQALAAGMGWTNAQVDDLWRTAAAL